MGNILENVSNFLLEQEEVQKTLDKLREKIEKPVVDAISPALQSINNILDGNAIDEFAAGLERIGTFCSENKELVIGLAIAFGLLGIGIAGFLIQQNLMTITTYIGATALYALDAAMAICNGTAWLLNGAFTFLTANGLIIAAVIIGIVAVGYLLIKNWDTVKAFLITCWETIKTVAMTVWDAIKTAISTVCQVIGAIVLFIWNSIREYISVVCQVIWTIISTVWNMISSIISTVCQVIYTVISTIWNGIITIISGVVNGIRSIVSSGFSIVSETVSRIFNGIKNTVMGIWNGIGKGIQSVVNGIISVINGMIRAMNKINFNIPDWVPVLGGKSFGFNLPEVSKVSWFRTGGIFTGASVIGVGEAGDEAVVPLSNKARMKPFAYAVASMMPNVKKSNSQDGNINIEVGQLVVREEADIKRIANELRVLQLREKRKNGV